MRLVSGLILVIIVVSAGRGAGGLDDSRTILAKEILDKIERGERVDYDNIEIVGDIDVRRNYSRAPNFVSSPIIITASKVYGNVNFDDAIMQEPVDFRGTKFLGLSGFNGTEFLKDADFSNSQFYRTVLFWRTKFDSDANFNGAFFNESGNFWSANFAGNYARFTRVRFNDYAIFDSVQFNVEEANFEESKFFGPAIFQNAKFQGHSDFRGILFKDSADFRSAQFDQRCDFSGVEFRKDINLIGAKFLSLNVDWDTLKDKLICSGQTYLLLIKNFRDMEQFGDADNCYYQYRDFERQYEPLGWGKFLDYLSWLSCGYGVRWQHPILSGILIAILFGMYYASFGLKSKSTSIIHEQELKNPFKYDLIRNFAKYMSFSIMLLLSLSPEWSRFGRDEYTEFVKNHWFSSILERLIGWSLMLLLIGTLSRLMIRY